MHLLSLSTILGFILVSFTATTTKTTQAFTITTPSKGLTLASAASNNNIKKCCHQSQLFRKIQNNQLCMTESSSSNDSKGEDSTSPSSDIVDNVTDSTTQSSLKSKSSSTDNDSRNILLSALIVGPPLIAKFAVVLLVKFVTDIIVFPSLFLARLGTLMCKKIVGLFKPQDEIMNGEKINGTS